MKTNADQVRALRTEPLDDFMIDTLKDIAGGMSKILV